MAQASFTLPKQSWYLIVWSQNSKNWAKMNKIVQKWQFRRTFYTTMKMEVGISLNGPNKWFPPYWFLIAQHMKYQKIIMRAPVHFFWVVTTLGLQCLVRTYIKICWPPSCPHALLATQQSFFKPYDTWIPQRFGFLHRK